MQSVLHKAASRGLADHGWLRSRHTFSFADYHNRQRMHFGLLRVINDDIVRPAMGFDSHPHENMEIVSIPLSGALRHEDSMGNRHIINAGEIQVMTAGSGLNHSEYNNSDHEDVNFLQIWIFPDKKDITPNYGQKTFARRDRHNRFQTLVAPDKNPDTLWINQQAWFSMANLETDTCLEYQQHRPGQGVYLLVIEGEVKINGQRLNCRDGLGLSDVSKIKIRAQSPAEILSIEVPMK